MSGKRIGRQTPTFEVGPRYTKTDGTDAGALARAYGLAPDPWQQHLIDLWLATDARGNYKVRTAALSTPRQNGKNSILEMYELFMLAVMAKSILHTAHQVKTEKKSFKRLAAFFDDKRHYPELYALSNNGRNIRRTNGEEAIALTNGGLIEFASRSKNSARGFTDEIVVFDEAQELTDDQLEAIIPSASTGAVAQQILTGTPPYPSCLGTVFRATRKEAHEIAESKSRRGLTLAWSEWSVDEVGDVYDEERWYETNPALGIRIDAAFIREIELKTMRPDGFARERLGWWSKTQADPLIDLEDWERLALAESERAPEGAPCYGVKFSPDGSHYALAVCLLGATHRMAPRYRAQGKDKVVLDTTEATVMTDIPYLELVEYGDMGSGVAPLARWLSERWRSSRGIYIDGQQGAAALVAKLKELGVPPNPAVVHLLSTKEVIAASSMFLNALNEHKLCHFHQELLDHVVACVQKRPIGSNGGFAWKSIDDSDVSPFDAVCFAYYGATTSRRDPTRKVSAGWL